METELFAAVQQMKSNGHMSQLLNKYELLLKLTGDEGMWFLEFQGDDIEFLSRSQTTEADVVITGDDTYLKHLYRGEDFLLAMIKRGDLKAEGSLKHLLWLESLFFLCKSQSSNSV